MPPTSKASKLSAKYGNRANQAIVAHADDDTTYGFISLPAGIKNGVAQLQKCYFDEYKEDKDSTGVKKGDLFFRAVGVVVEPTSPVLTDSGPMVVTNLTTTLVIPVPDCKRYGRQVTMDENLAEIMLHMRRLGGPDFTEGATVDDLEDLASQLEEMGPYFRFTTEAVFASKDDPNKNIKKGQKLDIVNERWHGTQGLDNYEPPVATSVVIVGGAAAKNGKPSANGSETVGKADHAPAPAPRTTTPARKPAAPPKPAPEPEPAEDLDLDSLAADAADGDSPTAEESGNTLIRLGVELGLDEDWIRTGSESWDQVVDAIREKQSEGGDGTTGEDGDEDAGAAGPQVDDDVGYRPMDPRTKKQVKAPVKCTVISVNEDEQTVTLKAGKASYKDVPWSDLERDE